MIFKFEDLVFSVLVILSSHSNMTDIQLLHMKYIIAITIIDG